MAERIPTVTAIEQEWDEDYPLSALARPADRRTKQVDPWVTAILDDLDARTEAAWRRRFRG